MNLGSKSGQFRGAPIIFSQKNGPMNCPVWRENSFENLRLFGDRPAAGLAVENLRLVTSANLTTPEKPFFLSWISCVSWSTQPTARAQSDSCLTCRRRGPTRGGRTSRRRQKRVGLRQSGGALPQKIRVTFSGRDWRLVSAFVTDPTRDLAAPPAADESAFFLLRA